MTAPVELGDIAVVDNHCHAVEAEQPGGVAQWRQLFSGSPDPRMRTEDVAETVFYRRLLRLELAFQDLVAGSVLGELASDGDLSAAEARRAGERILNGNARRVYGLTGQAGQDGRAGDGTGK